MLNKNSEIIALLESAKDSMIDFMPHASYTQSDVEKCMQILNAYLEKMESCNSKAEGMALVKQTVLALNDLNESLEHELIETDQREDICEIIILASHLKGINDRDDDITEDWRDW